MRSEKDKRLIQFGSHLGSVGKELSLSEDFLEQRVIWQRVLLVKFGIEIGI